MAANVQFRPRERDLGMVMREVDEILAIFLGMKNIESKRVDPKSERIEPVDSNYCLDSALDTKGYDWLIAQPVNESAKNPAEFSSPIVEILNDAGESVSVSKNSSSAVVAEKRRPLSSAGDRKPTTPWEATPTGQRPIKLKPSRTSTPTPTRAAFPSSKSTSASYKPRSSTPTRKSITPFTKPGGSDSRKTGPAETRGSFQTVKSRPSKPSETQITKTPLTRRPASASRGRPSNAHTSSSVGELRQKSCSPAKTRVRNGNAVAKDGNIVMPKVRGYSNGDGDDVNPVVIGTKMVERVVNMRKLAPPKHDNDNINAKKSSSLADSGFGRSLSKKSLDMAIRHMGIKGSIHDGLSPVTTALSSPARGTQSSSTKNSVVSVPESPVTSSSDSSKWSNGVNSYFLDGRCMD